MPPPAVPPFFLIVRKSQGVSTHIMCLQRKKKRQWRINGKISFLTQEKHETSKVCVFVCFSPLLLFFYAFHAFSPLTTIVYIFWFAHALRCYSDNAILKFPLWDIATVAMNTKSRISNFWNKNKWKKIFFFFEVPSKTIDTMVSLHKFY